MSEFEITRRGVTLGTLSIIAAGVVGNSALAAVVDATTKTAGKIVEKELYAIIPCVYPHYHEPDTLIEDNCITNIWKVMERWTKENGEYRIETAKVGSDRYKEWLLTYDFANKDDIPPHISFGGGVVPNPAGDPTFYSRWVDRTKAHLASGRLV